MKKLGIALVVTFLFISSAFLLPLIVAPTSFAQGSSDHQDIPDNLTMTGTNFLPSFPLPVAGGLVFLLVMLCVRVLGIKVSTKLFKTLLIIGGSVLVIGVFSQLPILENFGLCIPKSISEPDCVIVQAIQLPQPSDPVPPSMVVSSDGRLSLEGALPQLSLKDNRLDVKGVHRAGKYEGRIDLLPTAEKGVVKITVNVADWWPYAFLTICFGVILGFGMTRYYKQTRPMEEQRVRSSELWYKIAESQSRFLLEHYGRPYDSYSMVDLAKDWIAQTIKDLENNKVDNAKTRLELLEKYSKTFEQFRVAVINLDELQTQLRTKAQNHTLGTNFDNMHIFQVTAQVLKGAPFEFSSEDEQGKELVARQKEVQDCTSWMKTLDATFTSIVGYMADVKNINTTEWTAETITQMAEQKDILEKQGRVALLGQNKADVELANRQSVDAYRLIIDLKQKAEQEAEQKARTAALKEEKPSSGFRALSMETYEYPSKKTSVPKAVPPEVSALTYTSKSPDGPWPADQLNLDDLFTFAATISFPSPLEAMYRVQWDFDDGFVTTPRTIPVGTTGSVPIKTSHCFAKGGICTIKLKDGSDSVLKSIEVDIPKESRRRERLLFAFHRTERDMTYITGLVAIGSGFLTLYLSNAAWGAPKDYLTAILWGAVMSEGLKYINSMVTRVWPGT